MLKLKELLYKITDFITWVGTLNNNGWFVESEASMTKVGNIWTKGSVTFYRRGRTVTCKMTSCQFTAVSAQTQVGTIPEGYRPLIETMVVMDSGETGAMFLEGNGVVYIRPAMPDNVNTWGHVTYNI